MSILRIISILLISALIISCDNILEGASESSTHNVKTDLYSDYKLYYGKWKITDCLVGSPALFSERKGTIIEYGPNCFSVNDHAEEAEFCEVIIPIYKENQLYHTDRITLQEMGLTGKYFVYTRLKRVHGSQRGDYFLEPGAAFYIKDDNTLILVDSSLTMIATRLGYIEGKEDFYISP